MQYTIQVEYKLAYFLLYHVFHVYHQAESESEIASADRTECAQIDVLDGMLTLQSRNLNGDTRP